MSQEEPFSNLKHSNFAITLPTTLPQSVLQAQLQERAPWFYSYKFSNGAITQSESSDIDLIHSYRTEAIFSHLDHLFKERWSSISCLDIGCHEGWFSFQTALRGASSVRGVELRANSITKARWLKEITALKNVRFERDDLFTLNPASLGTFDLVWLVGVFYHLENPMGALRIARSMTKEVCVLEGQVARAQEIGTEWGPVGNLRQGPGLVVLPGEPVHAHYPSGVVFVPTLEALRLMLLHAGFSVIHLVLPSLKAYQSFQLYDRVIVFAYP